MKGEWIGKNCGGCLNHMAWVRNPQIFLDIKKNTSINVTLFQPQSDSQLSISFYVFKTHSPLSMYTYTISLISNTEKKLVQRYKEEDIVAEGSFSTSKPSRGDYYTHIDH